MVGGYVVGEVNPNIWDITAPPLKLQLLHLLSWEQGPLPSQIPNYLVILSKNC